MKQTLRSLTGDAGLTANSCDKTSYVRRTSQSRRFAAVALTLALLTPLSAAAVQDEQNKPEQTNAGDAKPAPQRTAVQILDAAIDAAGSHTSIQADLREDVVMGTRRFRATGRYVQGTNNQLRLNIEIHPIEEVATRAKKPEDKATGEGKDSAKAKGQSAAGKAPTESGSDEPANKKSGVLHVCDGQVLWTQWTIEGKSNVERRDVKEILKAFSGPTNIDTNQLLADLGLGGVPGLLVSMKKRMVFKGVRNETIDGKEFVVIQGRWTDEQLSRFIPGNEQPDPLLPDFLPEYVRLYFEADTLFPRRVLYLKRHPNPEQKLARPMITLDFSNVVINGDVDNSLFSFNATATKNQTDITDNLIKALRQQTGR